MRSDYPDFTGWLRQVCAWICVLSVIIFASGQARSADNGNWVVMPLPVVTSNPILSNPLKGFYGWYSVDTVPINPPATDHYFRFSWSDLETGEGVYDFSVIENELKKFQAHDRIAFGIMPLNTCCSGSGLDVPKYLADHLAKGFWIKADPNNSGGIAKSYVPDWNDPYYLERWDQLLQALGQKYNNSPKIAWVDLRGYGNWGEGHVAGAMAYPSTEIPYADGTVNIHGAKPGSLETKKSIIRSIVKAFPDTQLLAMTDQKDVLIDTLKLSPNIGLRRDSWGSKWFSEDLVPKNISKSDKALLLNRWKTAPFIVENHGWAKVFEAGLTGITDQIKTYHVSAIGNGNFNVQTYSQLTPKQQQALRNAANAAGYRYAPMNVRVRRTNFCSSEIEVSIRNDGVAPAYEPWSIKVILISSDGSIQAEVISKNALPKILPKESITETVCVEKTAETGAFALELQVVDPRNAARTMILPIEGGDEHNRYKIGQITIH